MLQSYFKNIALSLIIALTMNENQRDDLVPEKWEY